MGTHTEVVYVGDLGPSFLEDSAAGAQRETF